MKNHKELADSTWFMLIGDKVIALAILALLVPSFWAFQLIHSGSFWLGAALLAIWTVTDGFILWALHRHKYLRLLVSLSCTALGVVAAFLVVWQNG